MFPSLLKMFGSKPISNTVTTNTNSGVIQDFVSTEYLFLDALLKSSSNTFVKSFYEALYTNPYAVFLFIVLSVLLSFIIIRWCIYIFSKKKLKSHQQISIRIWKSFISPQFLQIGIIIGSIIGLGVLNIPIHFRNFLRVILFSMLLILIYILSYKLIRLYTKAILIFRTKGNRLKFFKNKNVFIVISRTFQAIWTLIMITIFLGLWGVQLGPILAGLGIAGIVVGLALQDSLSHIVGGISLMLDEAYTEGDYVILENGSEGTIFQVGYRSTKIRTFNEEIVIIPNGVLAKMIIKNLSQPVKRMRITTFYTTRAEDGEPDKIKSLLITAAKHVPAVLRYPEPYVFFLEPKGDTYYFRLNFFSHSPLTKLSLTDAVQQEVVKVFKENNIRFSPDESIVYLPNISKESSTFEKRSNTSSNTLERDELTP